MIPHITAPDEAEAGAILTVDLAAVRANYRLLAGLAAPAECAAVVKADAYGLGAAQVVPALAAEGCRSFFTAHWHEARALPPSARTIYVLNGVMPGAEAAAAEGGRIMPVLNSLAQAEAWSAQGAARGKALPAALHLDTGLSRLGLSAAEVEGLLAAPSVLRWLDLRLLVSHLASAEEPENPTNARQLAAFWALRQRFPGISASFANSSAFFLGADYLFDNARAGAALYGINPLPGRPNPMRQAVRLQARIVQLRDLAMGDAVGYGGAFVAERPMRAATVGLGYGDGWPRSARTAAFLDGARLPILGRVSMDTMVLDLSALPGGRAHPGLLVDFLCPEQTPDDVAAAAGTIGYEILTGLGRRPQRRFVEDGAPAVTMSAHHKE